MFTRLLLPLLLCPVLLTAPAAAQQAPAKELIVIRDYDDCMRFALALLRSVKLSRAGADVLVVFQDEAVLAALHYPLPPEKYDDVNIEEDFRRERNSGPHDFSKGTSGRSAAGSARYLRTKLPLDGRTRTPTELTMSTMAEFREKKIPYVVCSLSARVLGVYDQLKAKGEPLSPDNGQPPDLTALGAGRKVSVY